MATPHSTPAWAAFGRLVWMLLGPPALMIAAFAVVINGGGWFTLSDLFFVIVLGSVLLGRWVEHLGGNPLTGTGEPASPADLRRYFTLMIAVGAALWVFANVVGNHVLAK